jgi:hypothetical protein
MANKMEKPMPHPDDFMLVTVSLDFQAKLNPEVENPPEFETTSVECTFSAVEAADYMEKLVRAIHERRLYGFMAQEFAESAVGAHQWIERTTDDLLAEARARVEEDKVNND